MNFIVETRNEFTIQLVKILSPFLYEGFDSIYKDTINLKSNNSTSKIFKIFQQFIKKIPSWNKSIITMETNRILSQSRCNYLLDLIKAVIKSNILLLSGNSKVNNLNIEDYLDINISDFIHKCYIECARQFYSLPYLFSHDFKIIERKKNQKECFEIIDSSIREVIRTFLPIDNILKNYLSVDFVTNITENDDINTISNSNIIKKKKINTLINSDVVENFKSYETISSNQTENCSDDDKETSNLIKDIKNKFNAENFNQNKLDKIINPKFFLYKLKIRRL